MKEINLTDLEIMIGTLMLQETTLEVIPESYILPKILVMIEISIPISLT